MHEDFKHENKLNVFISCKKKEIHTYIQPVNKELRIDCKTCFFFPNRNQSSCGRRSIQSWLPTSCCKLSVESVVQTDKVEDL